MSASLPAEPAARQKPIFAILGSYIHHILNIFSKNIFIKCSSYFSLVSVEPAGQKSTFAILAIFIIVHIFIIFSKFHHIFIIFSSYFSLISKAKTIFAFSNLIQFHSLHTKSFHTIKITTNFAIIETCIGIVQ